MATVWRETHVVRDNLSDGNEVYHTNVMARVVYTILGIINGILAIRFVLVLLGANPANAFANLIYTLSRPLVAPFIGLFNYQPQYGVVRFEFETLIAMAVYTLLAWIIIRLVNPRGEPVD
jgi:hypothetical protein